jgi:hypothetical protein
MLYLKSDEEKKLVFEIDINGCNADELRGFVRFEIYGSEYGFPVDIEGKKITAIIPPLKEIVEKDIEDGTVVYARLDMITERHYFMPWDGEIKVGAPMGIKAKIKEDDSKPGVRTRLLTSENAGERKKQEKGSVVKEDDRMSRLEKLVEAMAQKMLSEDKQVEPSKKKVIQEIGSEDRIPDDPKKWTKNKLRNITEKDIIAYMKRKGTKNETIQEIILNKAREQAQSGDSYKVFVEVVKQLKKPKRK